MAIRMLENPCSCFSDGFSASDPISLLSAAGETLGSESIAGCFSASELAGSAVANSKQNELYILNRAKSMSLAKIRCPVLTQAV